MANLNKHRKAITEAGYTLSKDGTQVTNKEGKTVAGTNDNGFFSGSSTLTKIFKGDTKAKEKAPAKSSKKAPAKTAPKTSKRPPSKKGTSTGEGSGDKYAPPESPNKAPRISAKPKGRKTPMTKEQARKYTSASPTGTPTLMSQGGNNAETKGTSTTTAGRRNRNNTTPKVPVQKKMDDKYGDIGKDLQPMNVEDRGKRDMYQGETPASGSRKGPLPSREAWEDMSTSEKRRAGLPTTVYKWNKLLRAEGL